MQTSADKLRDEVRGMQIAKTNCEGSLAGIYADIEILEQQEKDLVVQGKAEKSKLAKERLVSQISRCRKNIKRQHAKGLLVSASINILDTQLANISISQSKNLIPAGLPCEEELVAASTEAEEMIENITNADEFANTLTVGVDDYMSDEDRSILAELEGETGGTKVTETEPAVPVAETEKEAESACTPVTYDRASPVA